jgi:hypothetical protein
MACAHAATPTSQGGVRLSCLPVFGVHAPTVELRIRLIVRPRPIDDMRLRLDRVAHGLRKLAALRLIERPAIDLDSLVVVLRRTGCCPERQSPVSTPRMAATCPAARPSGRCVVRRWPSPQWLRPRSVEREGSRSHPLHCLLDRLRKFVSDHVWKAALVALECGPQERIRLHL